MAALLRQHRLIASNDDPDDMPGFNAAFMSSLNDHFAWEGKIENVIALSIRDSGMSLVDLAHDNNKACPSGAVKDGSGDPRVKPPTDEGTTISSLKQSLRPLHTPLIYFISNLVKFIQISVIYNKFE
jgi:hypothetical protein